MDRNAFRKAFRSLGPAVLPVIHVQDQDQAIANVERAMSAGAQGVFLINHDFPVEPFLPIITAVRHRFPALWLGVNFLAVTGRDAFPVLAALGRQGTAVDAYWADDACIDERRPADRQDTAEAIATARRESGWDGLYFGGTAFKKQRPVEPDRFGESARIACGFMEVVTTSGIATGEAAEPGKIEAMRAAAGDHAMALASGVTPENARDYAHLVDALLVATGINRPGDFYTIDPGRLRRLIEITRAPASPSEPKKPRWYLDLMAPNLRGEKFAWLDPSSMYVKAEAFHALLDDLAGAFTPGDVDVVAGPDAMGFVLGTGLATRLGTGFLTIRKAGRIPVETDRVDFTNYTGRVQQLEMRKPAFAPGTRVLLVDQWIETGGTMSGAIRLVERQGGTVAGIASVCIEQNPATEDLRRRYKCVTAVQPGSTVQDQCDRQRLDTFDDFDWQAIFPAVQTQEA